MSYSLDWVSAEITNSSLRKELTKEQEHFHRVVFFSFPFLPLFLFRDLVFKADLRSLDLRNPPASALKHLELEAYVLPSESQVLPVLLQQPAAFKCATC